MLLQVVLTGRLDTAARHLTQRVGGDLVKVDGLAKGTEDIHQVVMRPSFVTKLNKADGVVYLGL